MRRTTTERSHKTTLRLVLGGKEKSGNVYSPFGPVRAGLITMPTPRARMENQDQVLTELLNSLERKIIDLSIRSCEVLNIFLSDTEHLVRHTNSFSNTGIIDTCNECGDDLVAEGQSKCLECLEKTMVLSSS
jgi:hypothetical protein